MAIPLLLAGPLLRRVEARSVAVWVALSEQATVAVTVFAGRQKSTGPGTSAGLTVATGSAPTRRFGPKLHVAVTVAEAPASLPSGSVLSYDVVVTAGGQAKGLKDLELLKDEGTPRLAGVDDAAPKHLALGYADDMLPSFATTAPTLEDLRLAHTSCRKSNGDGPDALAWLDPKLLEVLGSPAVPQALFLTGDQIYADDVGAALLPMLAGLATELVGPERLPVGGTPVAATLDRFPALRRQGTVNALGGFTTTAGSSHLLTFGEFAAMYLAAWSPRVWRPLATADQVFVAAPADAATTMATPWETRYTDAAGWRNAKKPGDPKQGTWGEAFEEERKAVEQFRDAVPKVARVLASIPTYMIFDDHEITDDWYISEQWRSEVLGKAFGRAVIRNGLAAYTVFQAWGNEPDAFKPQPTLPAAQRPANEKLLSALEEVVGRESPTAAKVTAIDDLLSLGSTTSAEPEVTFHYSVAAVQHKVAVLDTRTRRTYLAGRNGPPRLVGESLDDQLGEGPGDRDLLVVVSAAPVLFPKLFDTVVQPVASRVFDLGRHIQGARRPDPTEPVPALLGSQEYDVEGWSADEAHQEELLRRLGTYERVVVLSGDVHFASTLALDFWAAGDDTIDARIVQCTSSACRNQPSTAVRAVLRTLRLGQQLLRGLPVQRLAWERAWGGTKAVVVPSSAAIRPGRRARMLREPVLLPAAGWPAGTTLRADQQPDWRWSLTVLRDERTRQQLPAGAPEVPEIGWDPGDPLASYAEIAAAHQEVAGEPRDPVRLMVFRNNIGVVSFAADAGDVKVVHTILSMTEEGDEGDEFTQHEATLSRSPSPPAPVLQAG